MITQQLTRILYAEDEPDIRAIAKIALEDVGNLKVEYCENGKEVIKKLNSFKPDLILLDVMMPEMDGPMTLQEVRKLPGQASVPIVFMTAKIQPTEIAHYKSLGAIDVIVKPFDPMQLANTLRDIWTKYRNSL